MEELDQLFAFFREIDKEKQIVRQTYISDAVRKENDAEHAWHAAIMAILLSDYANEKIDVLKTVTMLMMRKQNKPKNKEKQRQQIVFLECFQKKKGRGCEDFGKNLRRERHQKPSLHG